MRKLKVVLIVVLVLMTMGDASSTRAGPLPGPSVQQDSGSLQASTAFTGAPKRIHLEQTSSPPKLTPEEQAARERWEQSHPLPADSPLPVGRTAVQRSDSAVDPRTATVEPISPSSEQPEAPNAPGTFTLFRNTDFGATIKANTSGATGEPTAANSGGIVFATGNWWAATSVNGGQTFQFVNPSTMFPASFGGFCCDQMTIYDPSRDIFIWSLQYLASGPAGSGRNLFRIAVARPADAIHGDWWYYDFNSAVNTEWDFPGLCLSNDNVYYLTNRGTYGAGTVNDAWVFRFPLDPLSTGAGFSYSFLDFGAAGIGNLSWRCAIGARETAYFGAHNTTSQVRIVRWAENSGTLFWDNVNLSAAWPNAVRACPTPPGGGDWCGFDDGRIKTGWVSRNMIGFMWNASAGGGFAVPYVEAVRVRESDRAYLNRPFMWNATVAFQYPSAAPNARGDVGVGVHFSSASYNPSFGLTVDDDYSRDAGFGPPNWTAVTIVRQGTQGPTVNRWGDYFSVQPFAPNGLGWVATGTTMQGCGGVGCKETRYVIFGRERDLRGVRNYYNAVATVLLPLVRK